MHTHTYAHTHTHTHTQIHTQIHTNNTHTHTYTHTPQLAMEDHRHYSHSFSQDSLRQVISEDRGWSSEDRGWSSEDRGRSSEDRGRRLHRENEYLCERLKSCEKGLSTLYQVSYPRIGKYTYVAMVTGSVAKLQHSDNCKSRSLEFLPLIKHVHQM